MSGVDIGGSSSRGSPTELDRQSQHVVAPYVRTTAVDAQDSCTDAASSSGQLRTADGCIRSCFRRSLTPAHTHVKLAQRCKTRKRHGSTRSSRASALRRKRSSLKRLEPKNNTASEPVPAEHDATPRSPQRRHRWRDLTRVMRHRSFLIDGFCGLRFRDPSTARWHANLPFCGALGRRRCGNFDACGQP
jgi:hypothetical protein